MVQKALLSTSHDGDDSTTSIVDKEAEKRVVKKIDRNLIPLVMFLCTVKYHVMG